MLNRKQLIVGAVGASSATAFFFLQLLSATAFWGVLGMSALLFCAGRIYWIHLSETKVIEEKTLDLLEAVPTTHIYEKEPIIDGTFREEEPAQKKKPFEESLPVAPTFPHCVPDMDETTFILGYTLDETGESVVVKDDMDEGVMSTAVIGKPKRGKTTLLYFFIAQMIMKNAQIMIFDPHATLGKLKNIFPYAHNCDTILSHVPEIHTELNARMERFDQNDGVCLDDPFWLVVDELPLLSLHEYMLKKNKIKFQSAIDAIQRVILEGRKFRMYCLVSGQSMPATVLPTLARSNIASHYAFYCSDDHARMSGFSKISIQTLLPKLRTAIGKCILDAATMETALLVAIPYTSADHIYTLVNTRSYSGVSQFSPSVQNTVHVPNYGAVTQDIIDRILYTIQHGNVSKRGDVCREARLSNRYYPVVRHICNEHGLLIENMKGEYQDERASY